jgi:hypothetical protein
VGAPNLNAREPDRGMGKSRDTLGGDPCEANLKRAPNLAILSQKSLEPVPRVDPVFFLRLGFVLRIPCRT